MRLAWIASIGAAVALRAWNALAGPMLHGYDGWSHVAYVLYLDLYHAIPFADQGWSYFHPPLHYLFGFLLAQAGNAEVLARGLALLGSLESLGIAALAAWLVRRALPGPPWLACLAFSTIAFLPVHVYASPMPGNEMAAALLVAAAVALFLVGERGAATSTGFVASARARWRPEPRDVTTGGLLGLAILAKANALVGLGAIIATLLIVACAARDPRSALPRAVGRAAAIALVALVITGPTLWRNTSELGTPFPANSSPRHAAEEARQPPGVRTLRDFVMPPGIAVLRDSSFDAPHLVRSIWGSAYFNAWFDTYRASQFPRFQAFTAQDYPIHRPTIAMAAFGLVPTLLAGLGAIVAIRRATHLRDDPGAVVDLGLVLLAGITLAFFSAFALRVPTFGAVKASYLLGLSLPFAWASALAARWLHERGQRVLLCVALVATGAAGVATVGVFSSGMLYPMRPDHTDIHALRAYFGEPNSARRWLAEPGVEQHRFAVELVAAVELGDGQYGRARELLAGIAGGSVSIEFANALATATALDGDPVQAVALWDRLLRAGRSLPEGLANRGATRALLGDLEGGRADIERALLHSEEMVAAWRNLAWVLAAQGSDGDARAMRQRAEALAARAPRGFPYGVGSGDLDFAGHDQRWMVELRDGGLGLYRPRRARWRGQVQPGMEP